MKTNTDKYFIRLKRVLEHIQTNLDSDLSLEKLCVIACFSPFHFHRQFRHAAGIPLNQYIRLIRMKQACYQLAYEGALSIGDISANTGFENSESFSRAFKTFTQQTPTQFRESPDWEDASKAFQSTNLSFHTESTVMNVNIITQAPINIAALEHHGSHHRLHHSIAQFIAWRKSSVQSPVNTSLTIGVPWTDPNTTAPDDFHFDICGSLNDNEEIEANDFDVIRKTIPGGRFAVYRHTGSTDNIDTPCYKLYQEWLPESGEELRDFPCFFHYIERMPSVAEHEQVTDIYLPLA